MLTEQTVLEFMKKEAYKPMTYQELESYFNIEDAEEFKDLLKLLNHLENEGKIIRTRSDRYGIPERMNLVLGKLQMHAKGFGFLLPEDREHPDVYIHANDLKNAMNNDVILVRVSGKKDGGKLEGEVVRIVKRANTEVVGVYQGYEGESFGFLLADDKRIVKDIFIPKSASLGAVDGQKVVVEIVKYPSKRAAAEGKVIEILGHKNDPGVDILSIIRKYKLPEGFTPDVMAEAEAVPDEISESDLQGRRDLRDQVIVTIDGADAKDLDDAVHVVRLPDGGYKLGVHIADVGYYVKEDSELDREAYRRGCSVYLVDRVIPMLPQRLSNGICSLNPQVDRLTLSCEMEFDADGRVVSHDIFPSVIKTKERMTYKSVKRILADEDAEEIERYRDLVDMFKLMEELALKLRDNRMERGAIDFDFSESKILVDENGKPTDIVKRERTIAEQIIEEFMLIANETVAEHYYWMKAPFLYRIHEDPNAEKLTHFMEFVTNFGHVIRGKGNSVHPRALQTLLEDIKGLKEETVISTMMLRSMQQAKYHHESQGHFGLAAKYYSHFTSPIRRYPDLIIHRMIREMAENGGQLTAKRKDKLEERMADIARQSSERERVAVDAERETDELKKAEYMLEHIGEEFEGIISSVTSFGMFVELENSVEGLIRLSGLTDDYYHFHERQMALIGERTSQIYRIGDEVKVRVSQVNLDEHNIDFELVEVHPRDSKTNAMDEALIEQRKRLIKDSRQGRGKAKGGKAKAKVKVNGGKVIKGKGKSKGRANGKGKGQGQAQDTRIERNPNNDATGTGEGGGVRKKKKSSKSKPLVQANAATKKAKKKKVIKKRRTSQT